MRFSAAMSAAFAWLFLAQLAHAQSPISGAPSPEPAPAESPEAATPAAPETAAPGGAQPPAGAPALQIVPADADEPALEPIPSARDTLTRHFIVGASLGLRWPFGSLENGIKQRAALGAGLALNLDLGFGLSRNVVLGGWAEFDDFSSPSRCSACSATSFAGGPFLRYHIVQGTRFDPWGVIAVGARRTAVDTGSATSKYFGPDWLRLTLGGDWYPFANVGVGPYLQFDLGSYTSHPQSQSGSVGTSLHTGLGTGLRVTLDFPGK